MKSFLLKSFFVFFLFSIYTSYSSEYRIQVLKDNHSQGKQVRLLRLVESELSIQAISNPVIILRKTDGQLFRTDNEGIDWYPYQLKSSNLIGFSVYPIPAIDEIFIKIASEKYQNGNIEITDILGNTILADELFNANGSTVDISKLTKGVYIINYRSDGESQSMKFIKH
jgi:hypothetical protein